jgi:3-oxoacyl-[acyl-carrier-protein] synthase II
MAMPKRRVVITGLGAVTSLGLDKESFWKGLCEGRSGIRPITRFDVSQHAVKFAGCCDDFDPAVAIPPRDVRRLDRHTQFALVAAAEAVKDAGLDFEKVNRDRAGAVLGTGIGGIAQMEEQQMVLHERGPGRVSPFFIAMLMPNSSPGHVAIVYGLRGYNAAVSTACASALHATGDAYFLIAYDRADLMITGGAEAGVTPLGLAGFINCKALSSRNDAPQKASRPFDKNRDGFVMGEGAGILVFEELGHAQARGARIYAEVVGFGATCDAYHITAPVPEGTGAAASMTLALQDAGLRPAEVVYINAHGTSTPLNDAMETRAVKLAFGDHAYRVAISSTKSMVGHLLGASGGVELIQTALTVARGVICPTINYETPDPECDLDYVPNVARQQEVPVALCNSFGFGGHNATVALARFNG